MESTTIRLSELPDHEATQRRVGANLTHRWARSSSAPGGTSSTLVGIGRMCRQNLFNFFLFLLCVFYRSTRLRAVKSTKRESSSSSWLTWSKTMDGSDATATPFSFSDLRMMFIELRAASTIDHPYPCPRHWPPPPPPPTIAQLPSTKKKNSPPFRSGGGGATV